MALSMQATATAAVAPRRRWVALVALLLAEAMGLLDATIVQVAAPEIHAGLGGAVSDIKWFSTAYTLPFAILLITGGRLGDIFGRRRVFRAGVTGFLIASAGCALAPSAGLLIGLRLVQGAAAAAMIPQTIGLIRAMFGGRELTRALGAIGPVMGLAGLCGPILGGVLIHADLFGSSWRSAFLVNVPIGIAILLLAPLLAEQRAPRRPRFDLTGTVLAMTGTGLVVFMLNESSRAWTSARDLAGMAAGGAVLVIFAGQQRRSAAHGRRPLIEPSLFASRTFPAALVTSFLFFMIPAGLTLVVILQLQLGLGAGAQTAGLTMAPWAAGTALASWVAGRYLVRRYGRRVMFAGIVVFGLGALAAIAVYHVASPHHYPTLLLGALALGGAGIGLFCPPFFTGALERVQPQEMGSAAGLLNAVQQLGVTLGVAVLGSVYLGATGAGTAAGSLPAAQAAFWIAPVVLLGCLVSGAFMAAPRHLRPAPAESAGARGGTAAHQATDPGGTA